MEIDFSRLDEAINPVYYPYLWDDRRVNIFFGGAGSGKSVFEAQRIIMRVVMEAGHNYLVIRKVAKTNRFSTFAILKQIIAQWGLHSVFSVRSSDMVITCKLNGNQIVFAGLDDIEKIKSTTFERGVLTNIWIEEASEIREDSYIQLNLRLRGISPVPFQITMTFNPISKSHWIFKRWFAGKLSEDVKVHKDDTTSILRTTYLDNEWIDEEYKKELERLKKIDRVFYEVYALGKWGIIGNVVFRNFKFQSCPYGMEDFDAVLAGMDFGFTHHYAIELIGLKGDDKYSFDELYVNHMTNDEVIKLNESEYVLTKDQPCNADSAEPRAIREWQLNGYTVLTAKKGPDSVKAGIDWLNRGTWYIDPVRCPGLSQEVETYKWRENADGEPMDKPVDFNDDGIAAARYAGERFFIGFNNAIGKPLEFAIG